MNRKLLSLALGSLFSIGAALAAPVPQDQSQDSNGGQQQSAERGRRHMDPEKEIAFLTKKLNLTADQQNQIKPILADRQQQMEALRADTSLSREDRFSKMKTIREDSRAKIEALLTADQKSTFEQMKPQGRSEHGAKDSNGSQN